jgi:beta-glucuronidase
MNLFKKLFSGVKNNRKLISILAATFLVMGVISYLINIVFGIMFVNGNNKITEGLLYPRESETREVRSLDGIWKFARCNVTNPSQGLREKWFLKDLEESVDTIDMPVPSSYNDITEDETLRDHVGTVWYERKFFVPKSWTSQQVWIRF